MPKKRRHRKGPPAARAASNDGAPTTPGRYTPATPTYRLRPRWHRVAGWLGVAAGVIVAIVNDAMVFAEGLTLLPGGHQELYLLLGIAVSGSSTWFLGLFDSGTTIFE